MKPLKILISPLPLVSTKMRLFADMSKSLGARQKTQIFSLLEFQDGLQAVLRLVNSLFRLVWASSWHTYRRAEGSFSCLFQRLVHFPKSLFQILKIHFVGLGARRGESQTPKYSVCQVGVRARWSTKPWRTRTKVSGKLVWTPG